MADQPELDYDSTPIEISSDETGISEGNTLISGNVRISQGSRLMTADNATLNSETRQVHLEGNVTLRERGVYLRGDQVHLNLQEEQATVTDGSYVLHKKHIHGSADSLYRDENNVLTVENSSYSYCAPDDAQWYLKSDWMELDPNTGQGKAKDVTLEVGGVPVFWLPYIQFPIGDQRMTGMLAPTISRSEDGLDLMFPVYVNLAPNYDLTLLPRFITQRGPQFGASFRHMSINTRTKVNGTYMYDDKVDDQRWLFDIYHRSGIRKPWTIALDITRVSDDEYFEDLENSGLSISRATHLKQRANFTYMTKHWDVGTEFLHYQTLRDTSEFDAYQKSPSFFADGTYFFGKGLEANLKNDFTHFDHRNSDPVTGTRLYNEVSLGWNSDWQAGFIDPTVHLYRMEQNLEDGIRPGLSDNPSVTVPGFSLDMGLNLIRSSGRYYHTLTPRLMYYYADHENQDDLNIFDTDDMQASYRQYFMTNRFSSQDRINDANQWTVGLSTSMYDTQTGIEKYRFGIAQIFYQRDRKINAFSPRAMLDLSDYIEDRQTRNHSAIATEFAWTINHKWRMQSELLWDDVRGDTEQGNIFFHYSNPDNRRLFSVGYRYLETISIGNNTRLNDNNRRFFVESVESSDISTYFPINNQWAIIARSHYDYDNHRSLNSMVGFEYDTCCWKFRTLYRKWKRNPDRVLDDDLQEDEKGIFFEIQLKTLGGLGDRIDSILDDDIYGY
jgi:LPS-assembly protein